MLPFEPFFIDRETACRLLGLCRTTYFLECRPGGRLVRVKQGRKSLVTLESVRRFAEEVLKTSLDLERAAPAKLARGSKPAKLNKAPSQAAAATCVDQPTPEVAGASLAAKSSQSQEFDTSWLTLAGVGTDGA